MGFGLHSGYSPTRQMTPWPSSLPDARRLDFSSPYASAYSGAALGAPGISAYLNGYSNALPTSPSEVRITLKFLTCNNPSAACGPFVLVSLSSRTVSSATAQSHKC